MKIKGLFLLLSSTLFGLAIATLLIWFVVGSPLVAKASITTTYTVCSSGCDFSSIQTAINTVNPGDTLSLAGETFTEIITVDKSLTIMGAGAENTIVQAAAQPGSASDSVIEVTDGISVTIQRMTVRYGNSMYGGGINNQGVLNLIDTIVYSNTAYMGGGIRLVDPGSITIVDSTITGNYASDSGSGIQIGSGILTITNSIISNNFTPDFNPPFGGSIDNLHGMVIITDSILTGNFPNAISNWDGNFTIKNSEICSNTAMVYSAGIYNGGFGTISIDSSKIYNNIGSNNTRGGGIRNQGVMTITNSSIYSNSSYEGGGIYNSSRNFSIINSAIFDNQSKYHGGGIYFMSWGMLNNVSIYNNVASGSGGGIFANYEVADFKNVTILNSKIFSNTAAAGGGIRNMGNLTITNGIVTNNEANVGGGISISGWGVSAITNSIISHNRARDRSGGGIYHVGTTLALTNNTICNNTAEEEGGGIYNAGETVTTIKNSILWENAADLGGKHIYNRYPASSVVSYSDIQDSGGSGTGWYSPLSTDDGGNIDVDPLFVDPDNDIYLLQSQSQAIDAGTISNCPTNDLLNNPRPLGLTCDMGAYEYWGIYLRKHASQPIPSPGQTITFSINAVNSITGTITGGLISDSIPNELIYLGPIMINPPLSGTVGVEPPTLVTDLMISMGEGVTVTFPVEVSDCLPSCTVITNTASITSTEMITPSQDDVRIMPSYPIFMPCLFAFSSCAPLYADDFSDPSSGWPIDDTGNILYEYLDREYRIRIRPVHETVGVRPGFAASDYIVGVDVRNATGVDGTYGLMVGIADDWSEFYSFEIDPYGNYAVYLYNSGSGWTLLASGSSGHIIPGTAINRLNVERDGSLLKVYANGQLLKSISNSTYTGLRYMGLIVSTYDQDNVDARFDNFTVTPVICGVTTTSLEADHLASQRTSVEQLSPATWKNAHDR